MNILCGDIGGTKTRLALYRGEPGGYDKVAEERFPSARFASLEEIARAFLQSENLTCDGACFGIAGPVRNQRCETTNLPWVIDAVEMADALKAKRVRLINDLEAMAYGVAALDTTDLLTLNEGVSGASGNGAVIAAGTGLGEAGLFWDGTEHYPFSSEGGHCSFAPTSDVERLLLQWLGERYEHVSWERVLSGPGLENVYHFICDYRSVPVDQRLRGSDDAKNLAGMISSAALGRQSDAAIEALTLFCHLYGAEAGNLALKVLATGGVYVGGGIAPKIVAKLREPDFLQGFVNKGRMQRLMQTIPVKVILSDRAPLLGALRCASKWIYA